MKTFNFYCDESCHLENDKMPFMLIGFISCAYNQVKLHNENIRKIKAKHRLYNETKWSALSKSSYQFYSDIVDYFFATDLQYRAIVINKLQLDHDAFDQTHDDFYYKMYFQLINKKLVQNYNYNIYLDVKDTKSAKKVNGLKKYLNANYVFVRNLQNIRSYESELMQLTDVLTGALSYHLRGLDGVIAKNKIISKIEAHAQLPLTKSTSKDQQKFNLFFIDLK